jgi:long-chain acyl-CoA synthetase
MIAYRLLASAGEEFPDRPALTFGARTWTFRDLADAADRLAALLANRGIKPGDLVGLLMPNRPEWFFWFGAISRVGGILVPINPAYAAAEVRSILQLARPRLLVLDEGLAKAWDTRTLREEVGDILPAGVVPDHEGRLADPAATPATAATVIYFSSGSTGTPKGIVHSSRNLELIVRAARTTWQLRPDDALLVAMPLAFVYASVVACLTAVSVGATVVLQDRFSPDEAVELISAGTLTAIMGVPSMYRRLLMAASGLRGLGRLRLCVSAGDVLSPALAQDFERAFACPLFDFYGLTEAPHTVAHVPGQDQRPRPLSCGRPLEGVTVRVVDEEGRDVGVGEIGELVMRAPWMFLEYFRDQAATGAVLRDGWFWTGDLVRQDRDGYLYVVERKKELIKRSGFNILPGEVEAAIREMPEVTEVAVVGVPDELHGQRVKAFVVRAGSTLTAEDIVAACRQRLAKYKIPEVIEFLSELPKGPTGKILKKRLRDS